MNKALSKAIMLRANLRNKFFKNRSNEKKNKLRETKKLMCCSSKENEKRVL